MRNCIRPGRHGLRRYGSVLLLAPRPDFDRDHPEEIFLEREFVNGIHGGVVDREDLENPSVRHSVEYEGL
jgi:hypothetical protein